MKITITGSSGFVGVNLQSYLNKKHQINTLSVRYKPNQNFKIDDDAFIHLSGKAHDLKKVSDPNEYYEANFELTKQLFDSFLDSNTKIFIFLSSVKAVTDKVDDVLNEEFEPTPKTHYGIAKHQAEEYILQKELPVGKRVYVLRPCMIHGPENKGNLNLLYKIVAKGIPWPLGAFKNKRSFLSIENLCFIIKELLENENILSGVYNVSDDKPLATNELIGILGNSIGKSNCILNLNPSLIKFFARIGDSLNFPLNSERLDKLTENYIVSNEKIIKAIAKQLPVTADEGLMKTFESFKNKKK